MLIRKPNECRDEFISFFKNNTIIPIVGSGISVGVPAQKGVVPCGKDYLNHMISDIAKCETITNIELNDISGMKFSEVAYL